MAFLFDINHTFGYYELKLTEGSMKPIDVIEYFGSQEKAAKALGMKQPNISKWLTRGVVPELRQYQIEKLTRGKLKVSIGDSK